MRVRRSLALTSLVALVLSFTGTSAWALSLQATATVNSSGGPVTVRYHTNAVTDGRVTYDTYVGPVPIPVRAYYEQGVAFIPFQLPVAAGGNTIGKFYYAISGPTGRSAWVMKANFLVIGTYTARMTSTAYADLRTGTSSVYYNYAGTGTCGCDAEDEDFVRVYVG